MSSEQPREIPDSRPTDEPVSRQARRGEAARLCAHLLVSNIRLYHEEDVLVGRAERDLSARLGKDIAAARTNYRSRFEDESVFDRELVRILAGGDPARLGP